MSGYQWRGLPGWAPEQVPAFAGERQAIADRARWREVRMRVLAIQAEAARRCGLDSYPRDLVTLAEIRDRPCWPGRPLR